MENYIQKLEMIQTITRDFSKKLELDEQVARGIQDIERNIYDFKQFGKELQLMLEDMVLTFEELQKIKNILTILNEKSSVAKELFSSQKLFIQAINEFFSNSRNIVEQLPYVYDVETSAFGDHVWSTNKKYFFSVNDDYLLSLLTSATKIFTNHSLTPRQTTPGEIEQNLMNLCNLFSHIESQIIPNVIYHKEPPLIQEINLSIKQLKNKFSFFKFLQTNNFFIEAIQSAHLGIEILENSEEIRETHPIKLKGLLIKKKGVNSLEKLTELLQFHYS